MSKKISKQKHILDYSDDKLTVNLIKNHEQSKYFIKKVLRFKIYKKVFKNWNLGIKSKDFIYLADAKKLIPNFNEKLRKHFYNRLNENFWGLRYVPIMINDDTFEVYLKYNNDIYDIKKVRDVLRGDLHIIGEMDNIIRYRNKDYYIIFDY